MSNPDSFIDEVSEEVRRDRLFGYLRRYGWIGLVLVLLIVGGAAAWEWRRSQIEAQAQARGDALRAALAEPDTAARVAALEPVAQAEPGAPVAALALAAEQQAAGESAAAVATLDALAGHGETPEIYRDIAALKSLLIDSERTAEDRLMALEALASPGAPLRMLALEQIALVRLEQGDTEAAIEQLRAIVEDAEATADLRDRATSLMVALGVTPETAARPVAPSE
ncbi:tetratricopeptide repeat protein [Limimaricola variabilis]|uniref:tetratricopeptide repeat protein n=1 Tax=Limimaricola variabilis TaxID=1492771 RepID=UPI002AC8A307|nr:tetratricopeptide repeat protein [Limimaricola variabilis]WPY95555.1 tetratricopeptide repeat protein [Limimaricola variabilis]